MTATAVRPPGHVVRPEDRQPIVTEWSGYDDWHNAPPNYDVFVRQYAGYTRVLCLRFGIRRVDVDDVVQYLLERFQGKDSLAVFDPTYVSKAGRPSKFRSYYSRFVHTYCMGLKRNSVRLAQHEMLIMDKPLSEDDPVTMADVRADEIGCGGDDDPVAAAEGADLADRMRRAVSDCPEPVVATAEALVVLSRTLSRPPGPSDVARVVGCSSTVARRAMAEVRRAVAPEVDADIPLSG